MKRLISIAMVMMVLLTMIVPMAHAECPNGCASPTPTVSTYYEYNSTQHRFVTKTVVKCMQCGDVIHTEIDKGAFENHKNKTTNLGHVNGTNQHQYKDTCSICSYTRTYSVTCNTCYIN